MRKLFLSIAFLISISTNAQNVGIDNPVPAEKLDVNGNINLSGSLKINSSSGTAGQVLVSNGNAAPSWQSIANPSVGFYAILNANQTVNNNVGTPLFPYTEFFDTQNNFNASTGSFTAPASGVYHFDVTTTFQSIPTSGNTSIRFFINGATFGGCIKPMYSPFTPINHSITHSVTIPLTIGQAVTYDIFQGVGSALTVQGGASNPNSSTFSGFRLY